LVLQRSASDGGLNTFFCRLGLAKSAFVGIPALIARSAMACWGVLQLLQLSANLLLAN